jgi:hypothetical protein
MSKPVTREILRAELEQQSMRLSAAWAAMLAFAVTVSKVFA